MLADRKDCAVRQTSRGFCQECCGCEAKNEFHVTPTDNKKKIDLYALEESSCCIRKCCGSLRPWTTNVYYEKLNGPLYARYLRPLRCMPANCKLCCCWQTMTVTDSAGYEIGGFQETCYTFVASYDIKDEHAKPIYSLHQPTCCCGTMVNCCAEGCCNFKIPFYIYKKGHEKEHHVGKIVKIWGGAASEVIGDGDTFMVEFPDDATPTLKATLLGATFMINQLYFESSHLGGGGSGKGGAPAEVELV